MGPEFKIINNFRDRKVGEYIREPDHLQYFSEMRKITESVRFPEKMFEKKEEIFLTPQIEFIFHDLFVVKLAE